jgi:hypothetical protein
MDYCVIPLPSKNQETTTKKKEYREEKKDWRPKTEFGRQNIILGK